MSVQDIQAIDVHAHYGFYITDRPDPLNALRSASGEEVVRRARIARVAQTVVSPIHAFMPRFHGDPVAGNVDATKVVAETDGLLQWAVVDPKTPRTYEQAEELLALPKCMGIKIHPEEHGYPIKEYGRAIFEFASKHRAVIQTHSGEENSLPADFVAFADDFPEINLIVSHLGWGIGFDISLQVRAIQTCRHGNMYTDTSSQMSITSGLLEWAVGQIGAEHILFGTDSPLYFSPMHRARVDHAFITDAQKRLILRENAMRLLHLPEGTLSDRSSYPGRVQR